MKVYVFKMNQKPLVVVQNSKEAAEKALLYYANRHKPEGLTYQKSFQDQIGVSVDKSTIVASVIGFARGTKSKPELEVRIYSFASNINRAPRYLVYRLTPGVKGQLHDSEGCIMSYRGFEYLWGKKLDFQYFVDVLRYIDRSYGIDTRYRSILSWAWKDKTAMQVIRSLCAG